MAENIEGHSRYPLNIRYQREFRENLEELSRVLISTASGPQIPISEGDQRERIAVGRSTSFLAG